MLRGRVVLRGCFVRGMGEGLGLGLGVCIEGRVKKLKGFVGGWEAV